MNVGVPLHPLNQCSGPNSMAKMRPKPFVGSFGDVVEN